MNNGFDLYTTMCQRLELKHYHNRKSVKDWWSRITHVNTVVTNLYVMSTIVIHSWMKCIIIIIIQMKIENLGVLMFCLKM